MTGMRVGASPANTLPQEDTVRTVMADTGLDGNASARLADRHAHAPGSRSALASANDVTICVHGDTRRR
jgi:hypothetical protein